MKNILLIILLLFVFSASAQILTHNEHADYGKNFNYDSLATVCQQATDAHFLKRIEDLEFINSVREGRMAVYQAQQYLIEGFKQVRHDALIRCMFGYARYMKGEIKKQEDKLADMKLKLVW